MQTQFATTNLFFFFFFNLFALVHLSVLFYLTRFYASMHHLAIVHYGLSDFLSRELGAFVGGKDPNLFPKKKKNQEIIEIMKREINGGKICLLLRLLTI